MKIHDTYLTQVKDIIGDLGTEVPIVNNNWEIKKNSDYILDTDAAVELGSIMVKNANLTLCTSEMNFEDKIVVIGKDINKLSGKVNDFAKVIMVSLSEIDDEDKRFRTIKSVSRSRLGLNFKGTMLRSSSSESMECFRVSKDAYKKGLNFSIVGSALIERLKSIDEVKNVQVYYIVDNKELGEKLIEYSDKINQVTGALSHAFDGVALDCGTCAIKEICDEVDGMRDSHKKMMNK